MPGIARANRVCQARLAPDRISVELLAEPGAGAMNFPQSGGCQCGAIRYEAPRLVYTCHCRDCQPLTSSAFSLGMVIAEGVFRLSGVDPRLLQRTADSGRVNTRLVCPNCGSWVCGLPRVGAGALDDASWLRPTWHVWTRNRQHWVLIPAGDEVFETQG